MSLDYDISSLGYDALLDRSGLVDFKDLMAPPIQENTASYGGGLADLTDGFTAPQTIQTGGTTASLTQGVGGTFSAGKTKFDNTESGYILGVDTDNLGKLYIGDPTNYLNWTGTALNLSGALAAGSLDIGGADATSFHVDANGNMWLGAALYANGVFKVSNAGVAAITSATIGGWTVDSTKLSAASAFINSAIPSIGLGSVTDYLTGTGFWVGLNAAAYKLHLGNPAGDHIKWDATNLTVTGAIIATTATVSNTTTDTFTINSDLTDANVDLVFGRTTGGSATLRYDGATVNIDKSLTVSGTAVVLTSRGLTAGAGLSGGGDLSADRTFTVGAGTLITVGTDDVGITPAASDYSFIKATTTPWAAAWTNISTLAGAGLTEATGILAVGAGTLVTVGVDTVGITDGANYQFIGTGAGTAATWTNLSTLAGGGITHTNGVLAVGAGTLITVNADDVAITAGANYQFITTGAGTTAAWADVSTLAGAGLTVATGVLAVGAGAGITVNADDVALTTPGTLTVSTSNDSTGSHTHAITSSSNPGATASLLASDASGFLTLVKLTTPTLSAAANLTISPAGDVVFDPTGNDILPSTNYDLNLGSLGKKYLTLHAAELWVETLVAQNTIATIGGRILVGPTTTLTRDLAAIDTTIYVKHNEMASGDRSYMEANGSVEFFAITSAATLEVEGDYSYTVTRNLDGTGANAWSAGDAMFNTGTTGDGFIDIYSVAGVKAGTEVGPTIVGNVRNSATYNDWTSHWAIGNLNGLYGYGVTTYGVGLGEYAASKAHVTLDSTDGLRFFTGTATVVSQWDATGNISVGQTASEHVYITSTAVQIKDGATVYTDLTAGTLTLGVSTTEHIAISSTSVQILDNATVYTDLTAGALSLGDTANEHTLINTSGVALKDGANVYALFAATTTIGLTASEHISISSTSVQIKDGSTVYTDLTAGALLLGQTGASQSNVYITSGALYLRNDTTNKITLAADGTAFFSGAVTIGDGATTSGTLTLNHFNTGGDTYIAGGTIDAAAWTANQGFLLGIDDSDSDKVKFYMGNATSHVDYNVTTADTVTIAGALSAVTGSVGALTVGGSLNISTSGNIRSGQTAYNTGTGFFMEYNAATPRISIGNPAGYYMTWDGTDLVINSATTNAQVFTGDGTWTKPTGAKMVMVVCIGAGGGGGAGNGDGIGAGTGGAGGGGGAIQSRMYSASDLAATVSVTIGAAGGGASGRGSDGSAGGNTSFGTYLTSYGGGGGGGGHPGGVVNSGGGGGGTAGAGDKGTPGSPATATSTNGISGQGGAPGTSGSSINGYAAEYGGGGGASSDGVSKTGGDSIYGAGAGGGGGSNSGNGNGGAGGGVGTYSNGNGGAGGAGNTGAGDGSNGTAGTAGTSLLCGTGGGGGGYGVGTGGNGGVGGSRGGGGGGGGGAGTTHGNGGNGGVGACYVYSW